MGKELTLHWPSCWARQQHSSYSSLLLSLLVGLGILLATWALLAAAGGRAPEGAPSAPSAEPRLPSARLRLLTPPSATQQEDVFLSVKTSGKLHESRVSLVLKTWFTLAREQTWFFSDRDDEGLQEKTNGHLVVTQCDSSHDRQALCCKLGAEFDAYLKSGKRWFCHFDDDNYVNVPALVRKLQTFDHRRDWYLGKPSLPKPLEIQDRMNGEQTTASFWFATGGAGFCLSRPLAERLRPLAAEGRFAAAGDKIRLPDDVTMGYLVEHALGTPLTVVDEFHSHLEPQRFVLEQRHRAFEDQISFSYSKYGEGGMNALDLDGPFDADEDPTRFKSIHCRLFPNFSWCPGRRRSRTSSSNL